MNRNLFRDYWNERLWATVLNYFYWRSRGHGMWRAIGKARWTL